MVTIRVVSLRRGWHPHLPLLPTSLPSWLNCKRETYCIEVEQRNAMTMSYIERDDLRYSNEGVVDYSHSP